MGQRNTYNLLDDDSAWIPVLYADREFKSVGIKRVIRDVNATRAIYTL